MSAKSEVKIESQRPSGERGWSNVDRVKYLLGRGGSKADVVHESIHALTDEELASFGLNAYYMNMLSLFGGRWPHQKIVTTAREAAISKLWLGWEYFHHYLPNIDPESNNLRLDDVPVEYIKELLKTGRGLVVVTFHLGHFRYIASDLAIAGVPICMPLARDSLCDFEAARKSSSSPACRENIRGVNAEDIRGSFELAKILSNGGCICASIDGNTGFDGPRGKDHRATVHFHGRSARVKDGLIKMAARFGSPIMPAFANTIDGKRKFHAGPIIDPLRPLAGEDAAHFAELAIQNLYQQFEGHLAAFAGEWSGCDHFHLWRVPVSHRSGGLEEVERQLIRDLESGGTIKINVNSIIELSRDDDVVLMDVNTMRCYRFPSEMHELVNKLSSDRGGVDQAWLEQHEDSKRSRIWCFLRQLASRGAVQSLGPEIASQ